jgi:hypothetical protein
MPKYLFIFPSHQQIEIETFPSIQEAKQHANLDQVDFGTLSQNLSIVVYEYGLMRGKPNEYFALGQSLFNGNAIIFQTDEEGENADINQNSIDIIQRNLKFYCDPQSAEIDILLGNIIRPESSINGQVFWSWKP